MDDEHQTQTTDRHDLSADMLAINEMLVVATVRQQEMAEIAARSEQRLRDLVQGLNAVVCEVGIETGRLTFLGQKSESFLGRTIESWYAATNFLSEIVHPSSRALTTALLPAFGDDRQNYEYEFRALSSDNEFVWMRNIVNQVRDPAGNSDLLRCVIVDVTEQRRISQALEAAYARERGITESLQRSLLFLPPDDLFPGLTVKSVYEAATNEAFIGGDFWDAFACGHCRVALVIGDVMGHGLPAAMFTAELKYTIRAFSREHETPARILIQMNDYLCEGDRVYRDGLNGEGSDSPLCLSIIIVDIPSGVCTSAGAGMESPLIVRKDGSLEHVDFGGLLLGVRPGQQYGEITFHLESGDVVIQTTDGVTEARQGGSFFGPTGIMQCARDMRESGSLEQIGKAILGRARTFSGGGLHDDACVLLARRE